MSGVKQVLKAKNASLEEALQEHSSKMLQNCKGGQRMEAGCDDKDSAYEYTLPAARAPLGDIIDLLGGEKMIKCTQGLARPQLEMLFAFLSNTGYAQNVGYYGRNQTGNSLCKRSKVKGSQ